VKHWCYYYWSCVRSIDGFTHHHRHGVAAGGELGGSRDGPQGAQVHLPGRLDGFLGRLAEGAAPHECPGVHPLPGPAQLRVEVLLSGRWPVLRALHANIISVKADNFIVSLCHWQLRPWLRLITLTCSPKPDSTYY
jgi:hypothetical protein